MRTSTGLEDLLARQPPRLPGAPNSQLSTAYATCTAAPSSPLRMHELAAHMLTGSAHCLTDVPTICAHMLTDGTICAYVHIGYVLISVRECVYAHELAAHICGYA